MLTGSKTSSNLLLGIPLKNRKNRSAPDPHAAREAAKYDNPIPSREFILETLGNASGPLHQSELENILGLTDENAIEALRRRLIAMCRDGQLVSNRRGAYGRLDKMDLVRGRVQGHRDGFGFLIPAEGGEDYFLSTRQMRKVFDGDEAVVRKVGLDQKGRLEGAIVEVVAHNTHQLVGRYFSENGIQFVRPDNARLSHDVMIAPGANKGARRGQFVVVHITQQPSRDNLPSGEVLEVLGDHMAPGMEIDVAIRSHGIPHLWPTEVKTEAATLPDQVADDDKHNRIDLRDLPFVTIDGEDARDFDDAVYCEKKKSGGWRLYVAIADVSHYVKVGSALDREAAERGNSVYFPDFVVPMLPEALSNGLCSLNPSVDRLTMVCEMSISAAGAVSRYQFFEGVIHSHARLTYNQVGQMLAEKNDGADTKVRQEYPSLVKHIDELYNLYKVLRLARDKRGAIDFDSVETRIIFDENRKIERIVPIVRNDAHKLIEECMLCANVCAARLLDKHDIAGIYRVHAGPGEEKLNNLKIFLAELGMGFSGKGKIEPKQYRQILESIGERPDAHIIQMVMLRSLSQAVYQPDNQGHFGLAYPAYTHFTSPIRRYPDLLVHRAIRYLLRSGIASPNLRPVKGAPTLEQKTIYPYNAVKMEQLGDICSRTERRADEATRDVMSWLKCEYLRDHVGEVYTGVVSSVTSFGLFIELKDLYVEGLIHITALPSDYYHFEQAQHRLVGERTRRVFRMGDEVIVRVAAVNLDDRKVDLDWAGEGGPKKGPAKKSGAKKTSKGRSGRNKRIAVETDAPAVESKATSKPRSIQERMQLLDDFSGSDKGQVRKRPLKAGAAAKTAASEKSDSARPKAKTKPKAKPSKGKQVRQAKTAKQAAAKKKPAAKKKAVKKKAPAGRSSAKKRN